MKGMQGLASLLSQKSLFHNLGTYTQKDILAILKEFKIYYCTGKYTKKIKAKDFACLTWYKKKKDSEGVYYMVYTVDSNRNIHANNLRELYLK